MIGNRLWVLLGLVLTVSEVMAQGSMYNEKTYQPLVSDQKAYRVGDALTVLIIESAAAASTVDTSANRSTELSARGQTLGQQQRGLSGSVNSSSDGGGQVVRSGRISAQITVTVTGIQDNGELLIAGQQTVDVNGESQNISIEGRVRPKDISDGNSVISTRVAEAHIVYSGQGYLAEKSKPGVFSRVLNWIGL